MPFTKAGAELLFEVASRPYERQSPVVTTNLPFEQWPEVCGSERLTGAMVPLFFGAPPMVTHRFCAALSVSSR